jgi:hypothetical protein
MDDHPLAALGLTADEERVCKQAAMATSCRAGRVR